MQAAAWANAYVKTLDIELLIKTVEKYEAIWNQDSKMYLNKGARNEAWNMVCKTVVKQWCTMSNEERVETSKEIKKRWFNVRDYYKKDLLKHKTYIYADVMSFMMPIFAKSISDIECIDKETQVGNSASFERGPDKPSATNKNQDDPNMRRLSFSEAMIIQALDKKATIMQNEEEDPDLHFFKSLLPDVEKLNGDQRVGFRIGVIKILDDVIKIRTRSSHSSDHASPSIDFGAGATTSDIIPTSASNTSPSNIFSSNTVFTDVVIKDECSPSSEHSLMDEYSPIDEKPEIDVQEEDL